MPETVVHFQIRMPPALHERLASRAREEKSSLNALVLRQNSIDEYGKSVNPSVASHDPGATEGGPPWPGNGHTR
jgi:ribose 1,5-bisphosphokinase PhnN